MSGLSLDAYRAMAGGKYNLGSVVVKTDAATGEQKLVKVNNSQHGRKVEVPAAESRQARSLLFSLMSADLGEVFGRGSKGVSEFLNDLRAVLFGRDGDRAEAELTRAQDGDLAKALNLFDAFKAKKLTERTAALSVKAAERNLVLTTAKFDAGFKNARAEAKQSLQTMERTISEKVETDVDTIERKIDGWRKAETEKVVQMGKQAEKASDAAGQDEAKERMALLRDVFERPTSAADDLARCKAKIARESATQAKLTADRGDALQKLAGAEAEIKAGLTAIQSSRRELQDALRYLRSTVLKGRSGAVDGKAYDTLRTAYGLSAGEKSFGRVLATRQEAVEKIAFTLRRDDASLTPLNAVVKAVDLLRADERALEKAGRHAPQPSLAGRWTAVGERSWEELAAPAAAAAREQAKGELETIETRLSALTSRLGELQGRVDHPEDGRNGAFLKLEGQLDRLEEKLKDSTGARREWILRLGRKLTGLKNEFADACAKAESWKEIRNSKGQPAPADGGAGVKEGTFDAWKRETAAAYTRAKETADRTEAEKKAWDNVRGNVLDEGEGEPEGPARDDELTPAMSAVSDELKRAKSNVAAAKARQTQRGQFHDSGTSDYWRRMGDVAQAYGDLLASLKEDASALKRACREAGVSIGERSFRRIFESRADAVRQTALALLGGTSAPKTVDAALVRAVRMLRDAEKTAARRADGPASLDKTDQALVGFLRGTRTAEDAKLFLSRNPDLRTCITNELQGGLLLLAMAPNTDQSVTLSIPLSANRRKTGAITLMQGADNTLHVNYKGHTFVLEMDAKTLYSAILGTKIVAAPDRTAYANYNPEMANSVEEQRRLKSEHENWRTNLFQDQCLDQGKIVGKIDAMLEKLRTLNNARPGIYGGAPHFDNKMPMLDADGARQHRVPFLDFSLKRFNFSGVRPETFLRTVYTQKIEKSGPLMGGLVRLWAKMIDVPLEAGSRDGTGNTVFEKAARYLHGIRILAQNANYILSRLNLDPEALGHRLYSKAEREICQKACDEFGRLTQFTVHPSFQGKEYSGRQIAQDIRDSLLMHCRVFDRITKMNSDDDFEQFYKTLASGACFNDCMSNMEKLRADFNIDDISTEPYLVKAAPDGAAQPVAEQSAPVEAAEPEAPEPEPEEPQEAPGPAPDSELQQAFEARRAAGLPAIAPSRAESLHQYKESLDAYLNGEIAGIYQSINESKSVLPKVFGWKEVRTFLQARMDKADADLREKAAADASHRLALRSEKLRREISATQGKINTLRSKAGMADQWFGYLFSNVPNMDAQAAREGKIKKLNGNDSLQALLREFCSRDDARALIRAGQRNELAAAFKDFFRARIDELRKTIDAAAREQADIGNPQYVQDKVETARRNGGLTLYFDAGSAAELSRKNPGLHGRLALEDAPDMDGYQNLRYDSAGFWDLVERVMVEEKLLKTDAAPEFVYGEKAPSLVEPKSGDRDGLIYTKICAVLAGGARGEAVVYDSAVHGDVTNFVKTVDEKGAPVWRTRDGRYEIYKPVEVTDHSLASLQGDVAYHAGDVRIPNNY